MVSRLGSHGQLSIGSPGRRLPSPVNADGVGSRSVIRQGVPVLGARLGRPRLRGSGRARPTHVHRGLEALVKVCLGPARYDGGPTALGLTSMKKVTRDAGGGLASGAESAPQGWSAQGGRGWGGVASSLVLGQPTAPGQIEHVHLSNIRLKLAARGRSEAESLRRTRAAA